VDAAGADSLLLADRHGAVMVTELVREGGGLRGERLRWDRHGGISWHR
jgi:hypothetical protein